MTLQEDQQSQFIYTLEISQTLDHQTDSIHQLIWGSQYTYSRRLPGLCSFRYDAPNLQETGDPREFRGQVGWGVRTSTWREGCGEYVWDAKQRSEGGWGWGNKIWREKINFKNKWLKTISKDQGSYLLRQSESYSPRRWHLEVDKLKGVRAVATGKRHSVHVSQTELVGFWVMKERWLTGRRMHGWWQNWH